MDETQTFPTEHIDPEEWKLFQLLDAAFAVETGNLSAKAAAPRELERTFPNLAGMQECVEKLERLAAGAAILPPLPAAPDSHARPSGPRMKFGRYEVLRQIGRGGMGIVFEARHPGLSKPVALKIVRSGQFASQDEINRFHTEARTAARIRHPNIVSVHDVDEWEGEHFFTMDLVCGPTLAELIRQQGPVEPRRAAELIAAVARAVDHLHQHRIIHRDLKPSNIILDEAGTPYVTDFGLAKVFEGDSQQTTTGTIIGTASYMPPEQAAGRPRDVSVRSDVYSLGAILYEMLSGRPPFGESNPLDTILQVLESPPEPLRCEGEPVPSELESLCLCCLEKDPSDRLESAARLADELERFLRNEPLQIEPRSRWERLRRWARREPALAYRLAIVAAGACVVQINYWLSMEFIPFAEHLRIMVVIAAWAATCIVCQRLMQREPWASRMPYLWAVTDVFFLTTLLILARPGKSIGPILIGYPLLVVASGLWFEVRLVWVMTALCCLAYLLVNLLRDEPLDSPAPGPAHYPYIFAVVLCGIGYIVACQVERIRALSRYFERRRE